MADKPIYSEYLKDKKVCLVGGASSYDAAMINSHYDIVARVGSHLSEQSDLMRDVIYHSGSDPENIIPDLMVAPHWTDFIVTNSLKPQSVKKFEETTIPVETFIMNCHAHKEKLEPFCSELGHEFAFTGFFAIWHLLQHDIKELFLTGMDLHPINLGSHDVEKHSIWLKKRIEEDERIALDSILEGAISICK